LFISLSFLCSLLSCRTIPSSSSNRFFSKPNQGNAIHLLLLLLQLKHGILLNKRSNEMRVLILFLRLHKTDFHDVVFVAETWLEFSSSSKT
jgi:hypothetical protein